MADVYYSPLSIYPLGYTVDCTGPTTNLGLTFCPGRRVRSAFFGRYAWLVSTCQVVNLGLILIFLRLAPSRAMRACTPAACPVPHPHKKQPYRYKYLQWQEYHQPNFEAPPLPVGPLQQVSLQQTARRMGSRKPLDLSLYPRAQLLHPTDLSYSAVRPAMRR